MPSILRVHSPHIVFPPSIRYNVPSAFIGSFFNEKSAKEKMFVRGFILCLPLFCFGCSAMPPEYLQTFQEAQAAFDAENYRQAATLYEQLIDQGVQSGAVYYNLGNAWAKAEEPVRAVAAYYLARRYIPNDPHLNANLQAVLTSNGGIMPSPESSLTGWIFFWQNWIGSPAKIWGSVLLAVLTFLSGVLYLYRRYQRFRRFLIGSAMLTAIAFASVGYDWYRFEYVERIIVTMNAQPRKGNSEQYEPVFAAPIPFGTLAVVLDERSDWYLLRFPDGQEGWLPHGQTFRLK